MFLLPAFLVLLVFGLAVFRLVQIPRRLWSGELRLAGSRFSALRVATVVANAVLLAGTVSWASRCCEPCCGALGMLPFVGARPPPAWHMARQSTHYSPRGPSTNSATQVKL